MILLPVKNLASAKQRLAPVLDQATRTKLAQAMLLDVLETLSTWRDRPEVAIVTSDTFAIARATEFGFGVIPDYANRGETDAIEMATRICEAMGAESTLVIPGDIPLLQVWELEKIVEVAPRAGSVLVPSAGGRGTNAVWRSPAALFPLQFGNDSFRPHLAAAQATGKPCVVISTPGIGLDVDNPDDLRQLAEAPGNTRAQRMARELNLTELPLAAGE